MSTCETVREQIQAQLDGLLHHEAAEIDAHVAACEGCAAELAAWRTLLASLENMPPVEAPTGFAESVMADLPEMLPAREGPAHLLAWGAGVAAVMSGFVATLATIYGDSGAGMIRQTLQPLTASLQLGGLMVGQATTAAINGLRLMSDALGELGPGGRLAFVLAFAGANAALLAFIARWSPALTGRRITRR